MGHSAWLTGSLIYLAAAVLAVPLARFLGLGSIIGYLGAGILIGPFGSAAIDHPVLCAVDRGLVRGMLSALYGEADTATSSSRPMGDDRCVTSITG